MHAVVTASLKAHRGYRSPQREQRARASAQRVLQAASALFADRGYAGTTIRAVAAEAKVSVPTVEALFGTKTRLLKAAIDVAIAGDAEPVPMLDRDWAAAAANATGVDDLLSIVADVIAPAQGRSSGLVLSVFEGAGSDPELAALATQMSTQRVTMASWVVARIAALQALRGEIAEDEAVDSVYALMEPAVFDRLTRQRGWTGARYATWFARSVRHLLVADAEQGPPSTTRKRSTT